MSHHARREVAFQMVLQGATCYKREDHAHGIGTRLTLSEAAVHGQQIRMTHAQHGLRLFFQQRLTMHHINVEWHAHKSLHVGSWNSPRNVS